MLREHRAVAGTAVAACTLCASVGQTWNARAQPNATALLLGCDSARALVGAACAAAWAWVGCACRVVALVDAADLEADSSILQGAVPKRVTASAARATEDRAAGLVGIERGLSADALERTLRGGQRFSAHPDAHAYRIAAAAIYRAGIGRANSSNALEDTIGASVRSRNGAATSLQAARAISRAGIGRADRANAQELTAESSALR